MRGTGESHGSTLSFRLFLVPCDSPTSRLASVTQLTSVLRPSVRLVPSATRGDRREPRVRRKETVSGEPAKAPRVGWAGGTRDMKTEGPFMKRDVKGSVTGPTSVSMSPPVISLLSHLVPKGPVRETKGASDRHRRERDG